jgi:hypothetical protein
MGRTLKDNGLSMEALGQDLGLDYYPLAISISSSSIAWEIHVYMKWFIRGIPAGRT